MSRLLAAGAGLGLLALAWSTAFAAAAPGPFSAHMARHVTVVSLAAPLLALALAGTVADPATRRAWLAAPVAATILELVVVWGWHLPAAHRLARGSAWAGVAEQTSFLAAGLLLWLSVLGGRASAERRGAGVLALLMTSMHMTLIGTLIALAPRDLYGHHAGGPDQALAGTIMLLGGAVTPLAGGLWLLARLLAAPPATREADHAPLP